MFWTEKSEIAQPTRSWRYARNCKVSRSDTVVVVDLGLFVFVVFFPILRFDGILRKLASSCFFFLFLFIRFIIGSYFFYVVPLLFHCLVADFSAVSWDGGSGRSADAAGANGRSLTPEPTPTKQVIAFFPGLIGFYWVLLGFTWFYRVLMGFTGFYWVLLGFTGLYRVLLDFTGFYWVLLDFTGFYWVLLGFTGFYRVLLSLTGFY